MLSPPVTAKCVVEVGEFEGERRPAGWQPLDWDFEYVGYLTETTCDESCSLNL